MIRTWGAYLIEYTAGWWSDPLSSVWPCFVTALAVVATVLLPWCGVRFQFLAYETLGGGFQLYNGVFRGWCIMLNYIYSLESGGWWYYVLYIRPLYVCTCIAPLSDWATRVWSCTTLEHALGVVWLMLLWWGGDFVCWELLRWPQR